MRPLGRTPGAASDWAVISGSALVALTRGWWPRLRVRAPVRTAPPRPVHRTDVERTAAAQQPASHQLVEGITFVVPSRQSAGDGLRRTKVLRTQSWRDAQESTPARHASVKRIVTGPATPDGLDAGRHPPCVRSGVMPVFELTLLGTFGLTALGTPRSLRSHKAQALLTYLALRPLQAHRRDTLASLLWSHVPTSQARHSLRQTISFIRSALDDVPTPLIVIEADTLRLNTPEVSVDAIRFAELASSGPGPDLRAANNRLHRRVARGRAPGRARVRPMACGRTRTPAPPRRGGVLARAAALNRRRADRRGDCHSAPSALARSPARMGAPCVDEALSPAGPVRGSAHTGTTTAPASSNRNSASSPNSRHASCWTNSEEAGGRLRPLTSRLRCPSQPAITVTPPFCPTLHNPELPLRPGLR